MHFIFMIFIIVQAISRSYFLYFILIPNYFLIFCFFLTNGFFLCFGLNFYYDFIIFANLIFIPIFFIHSD